MMIDGKPFFTAHSRMDRLPAEVFNQILENISSLDDLRALLLVNTRLASFCRGVPSKTLWHVVRSHCRDRCPKHGGALVRRLAFWRTLKLTLSGLEDSRTLSFLSSSVAAWLHCRASMRREGMFAGTGNGRCKLDAWKELYRVAVWLEGRELAQEWRKVWRIFRRQGRFARKSTAT